VACKPRSRAEVRAPRDGFVRRKGAFCRIHLTPVESRKGIKTSKCWSNGGNWQNLRSLFDNGLHWSYFPKTPSKILLRSSFLLLEPRSNQMDWLTIHHFFEVLSVYAGLVGISLYGLLIPLWKRLKRMSPRDKGAIRRRHAQ
jgi:hypothetical protein